MRAAVLILVAVLACSVAAANELGQPARQLLQGGAAGGSSVRSFSSVAQHKQPQAPKLTRKSFDQVKPDGRHLLDAGMDAFTRHLLQGGAAGGSSVRSFSGVAQHKQPQAPKVTRKNFDRNMPDGRRLMGQSVGLDAGDLEQLPSVATRNLLQGGGSHGSAVRPFTTVAQHKTPQAPQLTRKNFDRNMPDGRRLMSAGLDQVAAFTRQLLQGGAAGGSSVRSFSSIAQHKQPQAPKLTRKSFDRNTPDGRRLMGQESVGVDAGDLEQLPFVATRHLLQGGGGHGSAVRSFSSVAQHKQPQAPKLTRKNFDRNMPDGRRLMGQESVGVDAGDLEQLPSVATRTLLQGGGAHGNGNVRSFANVDQHKQPQAPKLTRKNFDRQTP